MLSLFNPPNCTKLKSNVVLLSPSAPELCQTATIERNLASDKTSTEKPGFFEKPGFWGVLHKPGFCCIRKIPNQWERKEQDVLQF